jgi:hypothetical protein
MTARITSRELMIVAIALAALLDFASVQLVYGARAWAAQATAPERAIA